MTGTDVKIVELSRALTDLEQNKLKNDKKISELQTQLQQYAKNENYLQDVVQNMKTTILVNNEKMLNFEQQTLLNQKAHEREKASWLAALDQANERIVALNNIVRQLQNDSDYDKFENLNENLVRKINEMKAVIENLGDQLDALRGENASQKITISDASDMIIKLQNDIYHKNILIKELEQTIKTSQEMSFTENEFDIVLEKLKFSKAENNSLKLETLKQAEEVEKLKKEISNLRRGLKDFRPEELGAHVGSLLLKIKTLQQEKMQLQEQVAVSQSICSDGGRRPKTFRFKTAVNKKLSLDEDRIGNEKFLYAQNMNQ